MAKILVVDDSAFTRNLIGSILEQGGHEVIGRAGDGAEALSMFKNLRPELVTLDYLMPGKDGETVLREMIALDPDARVIMISGSGDHTVEERALQTGAKAYLEKPDVKGNILQTVSHLMGG